MSDGTGTVATVSEPAPPSLHPHPEFPFRFRSEYELLSEIGRGGMGVIYKARQCCLDRLCAVKTLRPEDGGATPRAEALLRAEATAAGSLDHPNIVGIYEVGREAGELYFSMEFVDGEDLSRHVRTRVLDAPTIARLARKIAEAVAYAHGRGVMHHDLKPPTSSSIPGANPRSPTSASPAGSTKPAAATPPTASAAPTTSPPNRPPPASAIPASPPMSSASAPSSTSSSPTARLPRLHHRDTLHAVLESDPVQPSLIRPGVSADLETICLKCLQKGTLPPLRLGARSCR